MTTHVRSAVYLQCNNISIYLYYRRLNADESYTKLTARPSNFIRFVSDFQAFNIGIKHDFSCINICQVPWEVMKTEAGGRCFQHLPRDLANNTALKKHFRSLLLHKK